eukprot:946889_1
MFCTLSPLSFTLHMVPIAAPLFSFQVSIHLRRVSFSVSVLSRLLHMIPIVSCIFETVCHIQFIYSLLLSSFPYTFAPAIAMSLRFFLIHLVSVLWYHVHAVQSTFVYR